MAATTRISENYRYASTLDKLASARSDVDKEYEIATSGKKLQKLSDNPVGSIQVLRNRTQFANIQQYRKTIDFAKGFLARTEDALNSMMESLSRAKELAIQQANGTYDDSARQSVSEEIRQITGQVAILGNSSYNGKFIFGGFQTASPPIAEDGNYMGDDGKIYVQVDEDSFRPINIDGRKIFGVPLEDEGKRVPLISTLNHIFSAIRTNNQDELHIYMDKLDTTMDAVVASMASLGAQRVVLDDSLDRLEKKEIQLSKDQNDLEGADMTKSALDMHRAENLLQFSLQASSKMIGPSLLDFMK